MRKLAFPAMFAACLGVVLVGGSLAFAKNGDKGNARATLSSYQEVPTLSTAATGSFRATVDGTSIRYATTTITVTPANDSPEVADDLGNPETFEDTPVTLSFDFEDPDGDCPLAFVTTVSPDHGVLGPYQPGACHNGQQSVDVTYFPESDYSGSDSFSFVAHREK